MSQQFIDQVQLLMHAHQIQNTEHVFETSRNYQWLANKRPTITWMSTKHEFIIRRGLSKMNDDQKLKVLKQLIKWLEEHPNASPLKVPEMCINFLEKQETANLINNVTFSRMTSFRNSLRRFSILPNRVAPEMLNLNRNHNEPRRSVTFNDELMIYQIYN